MSQMSLRSAYEKAVTCENAVKKVGEKYETAIQEREVLTLKIKSLIEVAEIKYKERRIVRDEFAKQYFQNYSNIDPKQNSIYRKFLGLPDSPDSPDPTNDIQPS